MYEWTHEDWSPIRSRNDAFDVIGADLRESLIPELSSFAIDGDGAIIAGAWIFQPITPGGPLDGVAESRRRELTDGVAVVRDTVRDALCRAYDRGASSIAFDCHDSDPHLRPVIDQFDRVSGETVLLMELAAEAPPVD